MVCVKLVLSVLKTHTRARIYALTDRNNFSFIVFPSLELSIFTLLLFN